MVSSVHPTAPGQQILAPKISSKPQGGLSARAHDFPEGVAPAAASIGSTAARARLEQLVAFTRKTGAQILLISPKLRL